MSLEIINQALTKLSISELEQVIKKAAFLSGTKKISAPVLQPPVETKNHPLVVAILLYAKKYLGTPVNLTAIMQQKLNLISQEIEHIAKSFPLDRKNTLKLCDRLVEAGIIALKSELKPVSFQTLIYMKLSNPQELLATSYPGYSNSLIERFVLNASIK